MDQEQSSEWLFPSKFWLDPGDDEDDDDDEEWVSNPDSDSDSDSLDDYDYDPAFDVSKKHSACRSMCKHSGSSSLSFVKKGTRNDEDLQQFEEHEVPTVLEDPIPNEVVHLVTVDTHNIYYTKRKRKFHEKTGLGVFISDHNYLPLVAAAWVEPSGPLILHKLEVVKRGLELAEQKGCLQVELFCDTEVANIVGDMFLFDQGDRLAKLFLRFKHSQYSISPTVLLPILKEIFELKSQFKYVRIKPCRQKFTVAAEFMAGLGFRVEMNPKEFPMKFHHIIQDLYCKAMPTYEQENCLMGNFGSSSLSALKKKETKNDEDRQLDGLEEECPQPREELHMVYIDGYFGGETGGGFGAILYDGQGNPLVASAGVSEPVSKVYHQLQGVKRGLELAKKRRITRLDLCCNSSYISMVAGNKDFCDEKISLIDHPLSLTIINKEILELSSEFAEFCILVIPVNLNRAADYLAKKFDETVDEMLPENFPLRLRQIAREDVCDMHFGPWSRGLRNEK